MLLKILNLKYKIHTQFSQLKGMLSSLWQSFCRVGLAQSQIVLVYFEYENGVPTQQSEEELLVGTELSSKIGCPMIIIVLSQKKTIAENELVRLNWWKQCPLTRVVFAGD
jgi:hypothetical protein